MERYKKSPTAKEAVRQIGSFRSEQKGACEVFVYRLVGSLRTRTTRSQVGQAKDV